MSSLEDQGIEADQRRRHLGLTKTADRVRVYVQHTENCELCSPWPSLKTCRWGRDLRKQLGKKEES